MTLDKYVTIDAVAALPLRDAKHFVNGKIIHFDKSYNMAQSSSSARSKLFDMDVHYELISGRSLQAQFYTPNIPLLLATYTVRTRGSMSGQGIIDATNMLIADYIKSRKTIKLRRADG